MVKVTVDQEKCIGCGACVAVAPDLFEMDMQTMKSKVKRQPGADEVELAKQAETACPTQAIVVSD